MTDEELKKQLELKKVQLWQQIDTCQSNIAKIDAVLSTVFTSSTVPSMGSDTATIGVSLKDAIEFGIKASPPEFTIDNVEEAIRIRFPSQNFPRASLASSLWKITREKIVDEKSLVIERDGAGNQPTIYRKLL